ncbi:DUF4214 domain-containing protein [Undibacterium sp. TJN19]|uniref:DUF4214 domain-containing protein n=1 Tax=Undibacterium sp. TJN19 TaxID=3413055 RepID=UPI003BF0FA04
MAYIVGVDSLTDEKFWGTDSFYRSSTYQVSLGSKSYGTLSGSDWIDWYQLNLNGPGSYNLIVSTDVANNYSSSHFWNTSYSGVQIEITDKDGNTVPGISMATARVNVDGAISFTYSGNYSHGDYFIKVSNPGYTNADYVMTLNFSASTPVVDVIPPVLSSLKIPSTVNLVNGDAPLVITANATDIGSGVDSLLIVLDAALTYDVNANGGTYSAFAMIGAKDSWADGQSTQSFSIAGSNKNGVYHVISAKVTDLSGNSMTYTAAQLQALGVNTSINVVGAGDTTPPTIVSVKPDYFGTSVPVNSDIVLNFSEAIQRGSGIITLKDANGNVVGNFDAAGSTNLTISGSTLTIHPNTSFNAGTSYTVSIPNGSIKDLAGNNFSGTSSYSFTTLASSGLNLNGTAGNDYLLGSAGNDNISGGDGNDTIVGGAGNDNISGGAGTDTIVLSGKKANYYVSGTYTSYTIKDNVGNDGTDNVQQVERLQFTDGAIALDIDGVAGQAYRIYQAAFGRQPDLAGLGYWIKDMDKGSSLTTVAAGFFQSAEFQKLYGSNPSNSTLINNFYQNVLHRNPDQAGFDYWSNQLGKGLITPAGALASFCESSENQAQVLGQIKNGIDYLVWVG